MIMRIVVDLPAPLGPRNPVTIPGRTSNPTFIKLVRTDVSVADLAEGFAKLVG
jgi:hypothetical protein